MRRKTTFRVKVSRAIKEIDRKDWEAIYPRILESYDFFKTIDETLHKQFRLYYISIYENSHIVLAAPCFIMDYSLDTTVEGPAKEMIARFRKKIGRFLDFRVFICGSPACEGRIGVRYPHRPEIIRRLVKKMCAIAKKEKARFIAFKDFTEEYSGMFKTLERMGFHKIRSYPSVELNMNFNSFEDHLATLSSATRKDLKRKFNRSRKRGEIDFEVTGAINDIAKEAYGLYLNTLNKNDVQFERLTEDFFTAISRNMPDRTKYFLWKKDGRLVAFNLCLVSDDVLIDEYLGMDYSEAYKHHLYYVTFRDILNWCIQNGIRKYESGALGYDPKKRLKLKFLPQYIYARHTNPVMNMFLGPLCLALRPENYDPTLKSLRKHAKS